MAFGVKLRTNALLKQDNELLRRENDLLRDRMARSQRIVEEEEQEECIECDLDALKKQRKFLEYRTDKEKRLNQKGHADQLCQEFACEKKSKLLVLLQRFQILKTCMAEAELANVVHEMWRCRTQNSEDSLADLIEMINCEIEKCPDTMSPFVVDHIKDVMKDCM